jgi:Uma2 family endonuclease
MDSTLQTLTAEHLLAMGSEARFELVKGELRPMSPAGSRHGRIIMRITYPLTTFVNEHRLGEIFPADTGFILGRNPDTVRAPDVAFVSADRMSIVAETDGYCLGAPDLAVEVVSPSNRMNEIEKKITEYFAAGGRAVWVVNPKRRTVTIYNSGADPIVLPTAAKIDGGDELPGFSLKVSDVFP